jgi:hypothetical protein
MKIETIWSDSRIAGKAFGTGIHFSAPVYSGGGRDEILALPYLLICSYQTTRLAEWL